jgi:hypothetical protein
MLDLTDFDTVEILIRRDGKVVWINTERGCLFRVCRIRTLYVTDERNSPAPPDHAGEESHD